MHVKEIVSLITSKFSFKGLFNQIDTGISMLLAVKINLS